MYPEVERIVDEVARLRSLGMSPEQVAEDLRCSGIAVDYDPSTDTLSFDGSARRQAVR